MSIATRILLVPCLYAAVPAQTEPPPPAAPTTADPPVLRIEAVGPDGWRARLGPTNLGSMLESERGQQLWRPGVQQLVEGWRQLLGDDAAHAASMPRVLGYAGSIHVAVWTADSDRVERLAIVLDGDGRTDMKALAADLRTLQYRTLEGEWQQRRVGSLDLEVRTQDGDVMTAPVHEGNHLLIALSRDDSLEQVVQEARRMAATATGKPPGPSTPVLRVLYDTQRLVPLGRLGREAEMRRVLGIESLGEGSISLSAAGPQVQWELQQSFGSDERGLFGVFVPAIGALPSLLRMHPTTEGVSWRAGRLDLQALWRVAEELIVANRRDFGGEGAGDARAELHADMRKELGIDLATDLLAHLTDEMLFEGSIDTEEAEKSTWALAFRLRDAAAFGKSLSTMLRTIRPLLSREASTTHDGTEMHRYGNMLGYDLWLSVGQGMFVLAGGGNGEELTMSLLDRRKAMAAADAEPTPVPASFEDLGRHRPAGLQTLGRFELGGFARLPGELWLGIFGELLPAVGMAGEAAQPLDPEQAAEQAEAAYELLRQHNLATIRTGAGYADRTLRWRLWW